MMQFDEEVLCDKNISQYNKGHMTVVRQDVMIPQFCFEILEGKKWIAF